jgi:hypothetical protein
MSDAEQRLQRMNELLTPVVEQATDAWLADADLGVPDRDELLADIEGYLGSGEEAELDPTQQAAAERAAEAEIAYRRELSRVVRELGYRASEAWLALRLEPGDLATVPAEPRAPRWARLRPDDLLSTADRDPQVFAWWLWQSAELATYESETDERLRQWWLNRPDEATERALSLAREIWADAELRRALLAAEASGVALLETLEAGGDAAYLRLVLFG